MIRIHLNRQGFTLIELMAATAITGVLILIIMGFLANSILQISVDTARSDIQQDAQLALDTATNDIRLSSNADDANRWADVYSPGMPGNNLSWASNATTLVLATAAQNSSQDILFEDQLHYTSYKDNNIYFVQNNVLYKRTLAATATGNVAKTTCPESAKTNICKADRVLAKNVSTFSVRYFSGDNIEVTPSSARSIELTLTLNAERYGRPITATYTTRTVFRNE